MRSIKKPSGSTSISIITGTHDDTGARDPRRGTAIERQASGLRRRVVARYPRPMPKDVPARFEGFADPDRRFFRALARNQRREWFEAHRQEYEDGWLVPMRALMAELRERLDALLPTQPLAAPRVFRIHRDVRFSKDKSPYKTHIGGYVAVDGGGSGPAVAAPLYLHLGATELFACAGHYMMMPPQLARFRAAVEDERGAELARILQRLRKAGYTARAQEELKKVPRGVDPKHPRADLLRYKGLIVTFPALPPKLLVSRALVAWLVKRATPAAPLVEWLAATQE
jgi:uncharacterized protein (TIGR02453 family)